VFTAGLMRPLQSMTIGADEGATPNPLTAHRSFLPNGERPPVDVAARLGRSVVVPARRHTR
jgi:hypothetical protein